MPTLVMIPTALRKYTDDQSEVQIEGATVGDILGNLASEFSELKKHLYTEDGTIRSFVNVYLNNDDIRYLQQNDTAVGDSDTLSIVPSIAGGSI